VTEDGTTAYLRAATHTSHTAAIAAFAANVGEYLSTGEPQYELIRRLEDRGILSREIGQLFNEVRRAGNAASHALLRDQFIAKLQRKKRRLSERAVQAFEDSLGMTPAAFSERLKTLPIAEVAIWFARHPDGELEQVLDAFNDALWKEPAA
jgi:hypothetical protein